MWRQRRRLGQAAQMSPRRLDLDPFLKAKMLLA